MVDFAVNLLGKNHVVFIGNFEFGGKCFGNSICLSRNIAGKNFKK